MVRKNELLIRLQTELRNTRLHQRDYLAVHERNENSFRGRYRSGLRLSEPRNPHQSSNAKNNGQEIKKTYRGQTTILLYGIPVGDSS